MADTTTITIRIPISLREELDRLAKLTERSRSYLATEALGIYTRHELEIVEGILEGIADFEAGNFVPHEEVVAETKRIVEEAKAREAHNRKKAANG